MSVRPHRVSSEDLGDVREIERNDRVDAPSVAIQASHLLGVYFNATLPVRIEFWDHSAIGPVDAVGTIVLRSRDAVTRLITSPDELGLARAYIAGDLDIHGDLSATLDVLHRTLARTKLSPVAMLHVFIGASRVGAIRRPPRRPLEEIRLTGRRHSKGRDAAAVTHHYDVGNDFYRLVLGSSMTYSCARFRSDESTLDEAQFAKHDLVCRKLGLHQRLGARVLDIGCGWGSMAIHAASVYGARVVGITLSLEQARAARARVRDENLEHLIEIRRGDYRDLGGETFDAVSSVGMFEHVGKSRMDEYFSTVFSLLAPTGRLLNHAISRPGGTTMRGRTFMNRYVFPDGELIDVADVVGAMERAGFEVRDLESLREHYVHTLHAWVSNLERSWDRAVELVGEPRARVWRLYMAASANGFDDGYLNVHQVLGVVPRADGESGMPRTRATWEGPARARVVA